MAYDKTKTVAVGKALGDLVEAVTDDGIGMDDMDEFVALIATLKGAQSEMKTDTDAAVLHIASGLTDSFGDQRVNVEPPAIP